MTIMVMKMVVTMMMMVMMMMMMALNWETYLLQVGKAGGRKRRRKR